MHADEEAYFLVAFPRYRGSNQERQGGGGRKGSVAWRRTWKHELKRVDINLYKTEEVAYGYV